ncbi:MAG TPA: SsrA-binding protein SmpB [Candidatus Dojkabacteria bacterium]|nr:SsrA-binding protein SmpB [Candidatus Dojkabacteria bacterium]
MIENKNAKRNYNIKETVETGIVLLGEEVKSIKDNRADLKDSFVKVMNHELWLINTNIAKYKFSHNPKYDPIRTRKLLIKRSELTQLESKSKQWGMVLVPLKMYLKNNKVKVLVGLGRGLKRFEKKNVDKERDLTLELHREKREYMVK